MRPKYLSLDVSPLASNKESIRQTFAGNGVKSKLTIRNYSSLDGKKGTKSNSMLTYRNGVKQTDYRFQVINPHCMKKVALIESDFKLNIQDKKASFGMDLKNSNKLERR